MSDGSLEYVPLCYACRCRMGVGCKSRPTCVQRRAEAVRRHCAAGPRPAPYLLNGTGNWPIRPAPPLLVHELAGRRRTMDPDGPFGFSKRLAIGFAAMRQWAPLEHPER